MGSVRKKVEAKELLLDGNIAIPQDAAKFINALTKASAN
jgi:hypothetical protein